MFFSVGAAMQVQGKTALGMTVFRRASYPRGLRLVALERRVAALIRERGVLSMTQLRAALHHNADQDRLPRALANLRDAGLVVVRQERRFRTGRSRVIVAPAPPRERPNRDGPRDQYDHDEPRAHRVAWGAVERTYHKNVAGRWVEGATED